jgi:hypothetical protein
MKIEGVKKLLRQLDDLPEASHKSLVKSVDRTVKLGVNKAKAIVPNVTGHLKSGINGQLHVTEDAVVGYINFYDGDYKDGVAAKSINYGLGNMRFGYHFRDNVLLLIKARHQRAVQRQLKKAIQEAMRG